MKALEAQRYFDGSVLHGPAVVLIEADAVVDIVETVPASATTIRLDEDVLLAPGFVDLQVNGGGGVMFNDRPDVATLHRIAGAHARLGTTAILPTLISSDTATRSQAIQAAKAALAASVPGIAGLHLEGPFLNPARRGIHPARMIARPTEADIAALCAPFPAPLLVTLAPEMVGAEIIGRLCAAACVVFAGHSESSFAEAQSGFDAGMSGVTHLFNAMSPLGHREPGLVGTVLDTPQVFAGIIADGIHVAPEVLRIAMAAKRGTDRLFLVTDAMAPAGTTMQEFTLGGRRILRRDGRLTLDDGTLAGADCDLPHCLRVMVAKVGVPVAAALQMATSIPADCIRLSAQVGHLAPGRAADIVHFDDALHLKRVWRAGQAGQT